MNYKFGNILWVFSQNLLGRLPIPKMTVIDNVANYKILIYLDAPLSDFSSNNQEGEVQFNRFIREKFLVRTQEGQLLCYRVAFLDSSLQVMFTKLCSTKIMNWVQMSCFLKRPKNQ